MGNATDHVLGRNGWFFVNPEGTYGTFAKPAAGDAIRLLKSSFNFRQGRPLRMDARTTRSMQERYTLKKEVDWSLEGYLIPSGTAGTPPDIHDLLGMYMSGYANTPATSDIYTLESGQGVLGSCTLVRGHNLLWTQALTGAIGDELTLSVQGDGEARIRASGFAADMIHTGYSTLNGALAGGSAAFIVQTVDGDNYEAGSVVKIGTDDNSAAGFQVTVDSTRPTFTAESNISAQSNGAAVAPFMPTPTLTGSPLAGIVGSFNVAVTSGPGATNIPVTAFEVTIKNNVKMINDEAFQSKATDYLLGYREVTGSFTIRGRRDLIIYLANRKQFRAMDVAVTVGNTAGQRLVIDMDQIECDFEPEEVPEADEMTAKVPFTALGDSTGEDEIKWSFT